MAHQDYTGRGFGYHHDKVVLTFYFTSLEKESGMVYYSEVGLLVSFKSGQFCCGGLTFDIWG